MKINKINLLIAIIAFVMFVVGTLGVVFYALKIINKGIMVYITILLIGTLIFSVIFIYYIYAFLKKKEREFQWLIA